MTLLHATFIGLIVIASLLILYTTRVLYAVCALLCVLVGLFFILLLQEATFLSVAYVTLYGGGMLVLLLFSVFFLPHNKQDDRPEKWVSSSWETGLCGIAGWCFICFPTHLLSQKGVMSHPQAHNVTQIGLQILGPYAFAFEWVGITLLIVLVGVVYLMKAKSN